MEAAPAAQQSLGETVIEKDAFELDLKINEGYQAYGSELLRVALLAVAGLAAVWLRIYLPATSATRPPSGLFVSFVVSFLSLTSSCATALVYKYSSADSLAYQLTALRRRKRDRPAKDSFPGDLALAKKQERTRDVLFKRCSRLLSLTIVCLLLGVVSFGCGLLFLMK